MNAQAAINSFWNGFEWAAYEENTVPENIFSSRSEYITYSSGWNEFGNPMMLTASLWQRSTSWTGTVEKAEQIAEEIGLGGKVIRTDDGYIWLKRGTPFSQRMSDEDPAIRRIYLNVEVEFLTAK
jgi:hypothetical protein